MTDRIKYTSTGEPRGRGRPPVPALTLNVFLTALTDTMHVGRSAKLAGVDPSTLHHLRRRNPEFAAAWAAAMDGLPARVSDAIYEEAVEGTPIFNGEGKEIGRRRNTRLLERLGEQHGILPSSRPAIAVQVNQNGTASIASDQLDAGRRERLEALLHGRVLEGEAIEVSAAPAQPSGLPIASGETQLEDDGADLV